MYKYSAAFVLVCFLTTLTGVSALAGHDCCGNCREDMAHHPVGQQTVMVAEGCCPVEVPVEPNCACTFQFGGEQAPQAYALTHAGPTGDEQPIQIGVIISAKVRERRLPGSSCGTLHLEIRPRPGPIYLANQSFLC